MRAGASVPGAWTRLSAAPWPRPCAARCPAAPPPCCPASASPRPPPWPRCRYSTTQYSTVQYSTVQYSTVQYSTAGLGLHQVRGRGQPQEGRHHPQLRLPAGAHQVSGAVAVFRGIKPPILPGSGTRWRAAWACWRSWSSGSTPPTTPSWRSRWPWSRSGATRSVATSLVWGILNSNI